jgi:hypothetical protein
MTLSIALITTDVFVIDDIIYSMIIVINRLYYSIMLFLCSSRFKFNCSSC